MIKGHQIERKIYIRHFLDILQNYKEQDIIATKHTFFRLKEEDRKVFKDKIIKQYLLGQIPVLVGLQYNGNYAVFYKYNKDVLKVILEIKPRFINIVTFYITEKLPRI